MSKAFLRAHMDVETCSMVRLELEQSLEVCFELLVVLIWSFCLNVGFAYAFVGGTQDTSATSPWRQKLRFIIHVEDQDCTVSRAPRANARYRRLLKDIEMLEASMQSIRRRQY